MDDDRSTETDAKIEENSIITDKSIEKTPKKFSISKNHLLIGFGALILVAGSSAVTYFLTKNGSTKASNSTTSTTAANTGKDKAVNAEKEIATTKKVETYVWQVPQAVAALPIYEDLDNYYTKNQAGDSTLGSEFAAQHKYFLVGTKTDGTKAYVSTSPPMGIGAENALFLTEKDGKYTIYQQHSEGWFYAAKDGDPATYSGPKISSNTSIDSTTIISEIENKKEFSYKTQKLSTAGGFNSSLSFQQTTLPSKLEGNKLDSRYTKIADLPEGTLYSFVQTSDKSYEISNFYLLYKNHMAGSFIVSGELSKTKIDPITWKDATKNADDYASVGRGCGITGANEIALGVTKDMLEEIGKSDKGQAVYGFKAISALLASKHYEEYNSVKDSASGFYKEGDRDLTLEQYTARRPIYLVDDNLGRWLVFSNLRYVPQGGCAKPVVYIYPTETKTVNVSVGAKVTVSEPAYGLNGWQNVVASPNGALNFNGKQYESLFWEGYSDGVYPEINKGVVVPRSEVVSTWRSQLATMNLNEKEINDFVQFWESKIPDTPYVRISWLNTSDMQKLAPLYVTGGVDTMIRVFLDMKGLQEYEQIQPQQLVGIARNGFTVVEWGGLVNDGSVPKLQ